jgi:hypothetical protein
VNDPSAAERYVAGRMSETESLDFETRMISRPDLAADVDVRQRIKAGLTLLDEKGTLKPMVLERRPQARIFRHAAAAGVAVVVLSAGLMLWQRTSGGAVLLTAGDASGVPAAPYLLMQSRGQAALPVIEASKSSPLIELQMLAAGDPGTAFAVRLERVDADGGRVLGDIDATIGADGYVTTFVRVRGLESGRYTIQLRSAGENQSTHSFEFELKNAPP